MSTMSADEMQTLAEKLIGMKINKARGYTRRLDPDSEIELLRVGVGHELQTRYRLPNLGVRITLVEKARTNDYQDERMPQAFVQRGKAEPEFVEARVVPLN